MHAATVRERHPLRTAGLVAVGVVLVVALAGAALFLWLRNYAPLASLGPGSFAPGPNLEADVEPVTGSGGKTVFIPAYRPGRPFDTAFTIHNTGRFAVDVLGLATANGVPQLRAAELLATDSPAASADPEHVRPFERFRLDRGDTAIVVARWRLDCSKYTGEFFADSLPLRYRYLSLFTRTERVELPFAVTLRCSH